MKHFILFLALFSSTLFIACNTSASDSSTDTSSTTETTEDATNTPKEDTSWRAFWEEFQAAVKHGDMEAVKSLTHFGDRIEEENFIVNHEGFFTGELKEVILSTGFNDIPVTDESDDYPEYRSVAWQETYTNEDGEEFGSGLFLYFGKVEGKHRLVGFLAAG